MADPDFFAAGSPYLNHPLLTRARTVSEVDFILSQLGLSPGARVLDVGCGPGRHSIELASRGFDVVGVDASSAMIAAARARAADAGVAPQFRWIRGESFVAIRPFDAAICLFTTLGQITGAGENSGLVRRAYDALRPGGHFVVEVPQRDRAVNDLRLAERFGAGERYTDVTRRYDPADKTVTEVFEVVTPVSSQTYLLRYRLYSRDELIRLFEAAEFSIQAAFGDYAGSPLSPDSAVMLLIGRR